MQNKKIIIFGVIILVFLTVVSIGVVSSLRGAREASNEAILFSEIATSLSAPRNDEVSQVQKTVENFENLMKNGINENNAENLLGYFSEDVLQQDKIYKSQIFADIKNKKEQLSFKLAGYKILSVLKDEENKNYRITLEEARNYGEKSVDYGSKFSRVIILEKYKNNWKIKEYQKINNNNVYSGSLSGSRKYDGFYP